MQNRRVFRSSLGRLKDRVQVCKLEYTNAWGYMACKNFRPDAAAAWHESFISLG